MSKWQLEHRSTCCHTSTFENVFEKSTIRGCFAYETNISLNLLLFNQHDCIQQVAYSNRFSRKLSGHIQRRIENLRRDTYLYIHETITPPLINDHQVEEKKCCKHPRLTKLCLISVFCCHISEWLNKVQNASKQQKTNHFCTNIMEVSTVRGAFFFW